MRTPRVLIFTLALGILSSCAALTPRVVVEKNVSLKDKQALVQVFQRYWAYRLKEDVGEAFALEAPYVQEMVDRMERHLILLPKIQFCIPMAMLCSRSTRNIAPISCYARS